MKDELTKEPACTCGFDPERFDKHAANCAITQFHFLQAALEREERLGLSAPDCHSSHPESSPTTVYDDLDDLLERAHAMPRHASLERLKLRIRLALCRHKAALLNSTPVGESELKRSVTPTGYLKIEIPNSETYLQIPPADTNSTTDVIWLSRISHTGQEISYWVSKKDLVALLPLLHDFVDGNL